MVGLYRDPTGETIFERTSAVNNSVNATTTSIKLSENEGLRRRVKELENEVKEKNVCQRPYFQGLKLKMRFM